MDIKKFSKIAESLRQYRRTELKDFEKEVGNKPVDALYVDPFARRCCIKFRTLDL